MKENKNKSAEKNITHQEMGGYVIVTHQQAGFLIVLFLFFVCSHFIL